MSRLQSLLQIFPRWARRHKVVQTLLLLAPSMALQEIRFNDGGRLVADVREADARNCLLRGEFDPQFFAICAPFLGASARFFDVGANVGFCSFGLLQLAERLDVHLFEANPDVCRLLEQSAMLHPGRSIQINQACVTDSPGKSRFSARSTESVLGFVSSEGGFEVPNLVLDDYIESRRIERVDVMKVDVEGWELHVFRGASRAMRSGLIRTLYFEVATPHLRRAGTSIGEVLDVLEECGFDVYWCRPSGFGPAHRQPRFSQRIDVNRTALPVEAVQRQELPDEILTDWLAIHRSAGIRPR